MAETDKFTESTKDPSFPYLERASRMTLKLKQMSMTVPRVDLGAENLNTDGARDYYKEPK